MGKYKKQLASLYKVFFVYKAGFKYLYYRYIVAPRIYTYRGPLDRPVTNPGVSIHMLTCHRDILIALWSLASFYAVSEVVGVVTIHDDGTLTEEDRVHIMRLFPHVRIVSVNAFFEQHGTELQKFPTLYEFRKIYTKFQSKKLIDVYFERQADIVLYLDSDMLWFSNPQELVDAVQNGVRDVSYMMSNGSERVHVTFRDGTTTTDFVAECNSGVTLFHVDNYDLVSVSSYVERCDYMHKKFTDQACFGTVLQHVRILPRDRYFIKGTITQNTVMRHYTGPSREKFFFYGVSFLHKKILN